MPVRALQAQPFLDERNAAGPSRPSAAGAFVDVCARTEVPEGKVVAFEAFGRAFLVCNAAGTFYAVADRCTHAAWSLAGSDLLGCEIVCGLHGGRFDLRTGEAAASPASKPIQTFAVRAQGARIEVRVPPPPR